MTFSSHGFAARFRAPGYAARLCSNLSLLADYSHGASLHLGVYNGTGELNAGGLDGLASHLDEIRITPSLLILQQPQ